MRRARRRHACPRALTALLVVAVLATGCGGGTASVAAAGGGAAAPVTAPDPALRELLPKDLRHRGVLRIGTDASYAPASAFAQDGRTVVGFEPDLAAAVGRVLGVSTEMVTRPFDGLLDDLGAGRVDLVMSAMTDTPARQADADFVNYFSAGTAILIRRGNPSGILELGDLCGRPVALERGTVQVDLVQRAQRRCGAQPIDVRLFPDNARALVELRTGRAAAVLSDYPPAVELAGGARTRAYFQLASDTQYEPGLYGIAVRKDRPRLRDALHGALERVMASGEYSHVLEHWHVEGGAVRQPSVNAAAAR